MFWLIVAIVIVGYFIYWAIRQNTQVRAAIAIQAQPQQYRALDLSEYEKLPVATVRTAMVPTITKSILAYAPKIGQWTHELAEDFRGTMTPDNGWGNDGHWQLYTQTLFFACGYVTENLHSQLTKHEQAYLFIVMAGMALFENPNMLEPRSTDPTEHINSLVDDSALPAQVRQYIDASSAKKVFANEVKQWLFAPMDVRKQYIKEVSQRLDRISFDELIEG